jgi:hypothetical protein
MVPLRRWFLIGETVKIDLKEMLRKRSVDVNAKATFPAQALPCPGSTGIISALTD